MSPLQVVDKLQFFLHLWQIHFILFYFIWQDIPFRGGNISGMKDHAHLRDIVKGMLSPDCSSGFC